MEQDGRSSRSPRRVQGANGVPPTDTVGELAAALGVALRTHDVATGSQLSAVQASVDNLAAEQLRQKEEHEKRMADNEKRMD